MNREGPVTALLARWERDVTELTERYSQPALAGLTSQHIRELGDALKQDADELLNLAQAATVCGYSVDHLGRLVREGKVENHGRPNAPRVRRGDLPRKVHLREPSLPLTVASTRKQIARAVANRLRSD